MVQWPVTMDWDHLYKVAREARDRAYAPYSRFQVGAALLAEDGTVYSGCNVENRSFGLCICAERTAISKAVSEGRKTFQAIVVVTNCSPPAVPCGMCRETLIEFAKDMPVLLANTQGERQEVRLADLHPSPFEWPKELALDT